LKTIHLRGLAALLITHLSFAGMACAQTWNPTKPVRIIVPIVGSTNDVLARLVAPKLQEALGQPVIVENKPGAGGNIGADLVAKAKANPTKYAYASIAMGSASHLTMEMFKLAANVHMTHIPYRGAGAAVTDLIAGNVQAGFFVPGNVQQFAKDGRLKLLASSGQKRFASTPNVPTMIESGFRDFEATSWIGFLAPGGTPRNIIDRYNSELVKILHSPEVHEKLRDMEFEVVATSPEQFGTWIRSEIPRWGKVIKATGAKAD
jgi:tripartite-type tricarboxylate transporter receptor subunit TctC